MLQLIKKLTSAFSVSGNESGIAAIIEKEVSAKATSVSYDAVGNLIVYKKGVDSNHKAMVAAHMDEIGFIVTNIAENGFLNVSNVGGIYAVYSSYHTVRFQNGTNGIIVLNDKAVKSEPKVKDLVIDIGAKNRKDALRKVNIGDVCAIVPSFTRLLNNRYSAKALDNRLGCAVAIEAFNQLETPACDVYFVFTVQEEVGLRGSKAASFTVAPDYSFAVDVTRTGDVPGCDPMEVKLGNGAAVKIRDSSAICSKTIVDALTNAADANNIKYQYEILEGGGTDTASMQTTGAGSYAGAISVPVRYVHSPVEVFDLKDAEAAAKLLAAVLKVNIQ